VLGIAKRPDKTEYIQIVKLTGLGILVIGFLGLLVTVVFQLLGF